MENNSEKKDYHELLLSLISKENEGAASFDEKLQRIMQKTMQNLPEDIKKEILDDNEDVENLNNVRFTYIRALVGVLLAIKNSVPENEEISLFSVSLLRSIKIAIELIVSIGIVPCVLPGVGVDMSKLCPRAADQCHQDLTDWQKYEHLTFSANSLMTFYDESSLQPAVLSQIGPLLACLLQLSHVPLMKPSPNVTENPPEFHMTQDLYNKLKKDQMEFEHKLHFLLENCPQTIIMRELMVILGGEKTPAWLRKRTRGYLVEKILRPNGIVLLISALCEDVLDLGTHWNTLDIVSRLIATRHGSDPDLYYSTVCSQLLDLLSSRTIKHASTIANCCITALYECNPAVCAEKIVKKICAPLLIEDSSSDMLRGEKQVEKCIDDLTKCFVTFEAKFKHLPCSLLTIVAVPLFSLHVATRQSAFLLKRKIAQLLLRLLENSAMREKFIPIFLGHETSGGKFGRHLSTKFGTTGGIEIIGLEENLKYEEFADSLLDLTITNETLANNLFDYLLKYFATKQSRKNNLLETPEDELERIEKHLSAMKVLSTLANTSAIRDSQLKNPDRLFRFIRSLFDEYIKENCSEDDTEILYAGLMLVKMIVSDQEKSTDSKPFCDFVKFLKESRGRVSKFSSQLSLLIDETIESIETRGRADHRCYQDLSIDRKKSKKFDEAVRDLADPLLPVRAHGLITLTKLIETKDPCAETRKAIILKFFQENLKHEDSFIYLAAINGLCALATNYPQLTIETLVQEFIDMPQRVNSDELTSETRMKLGEILVKTTRTLGEMAPAYKNILVNGFLCAARDPDPLVRASSLSCLGELCKVLGFHLGNILMEIIYCISCIIKTDKSPECRRAAVLVCTLLLRGLGRHALTDLAEDLVDLYRALKQLHDNDKDPVMRLHAQLALEELDDIVKDFLFAPPKLEKSILLLN